MSYIFTFIHLADTFIHIYPFSRHLYPKQLTKYNTTVRVLSLWSSVIHGFVTEPSYSHHVLFSRESAVSSLLGRALFCPCVFCGVARSSCFHRLHAFTLCLVLCGTQLVYSLAVCFHGVMFCVNTWLMSFLISCVFVSCFEHGWWFVLLAMCLCFCFVWAHDFCLSFLCVMCSHVNSWLLFHLPHLSSLVTLLICYLYNLLVFAVLCRGSFCCCFVLFFISCKIKPILLHNWVLASSLHPQPCQQQSNSTQRDTPPQNEHFVINHLSSYHSKPVKA